jgi:hypothetical protein
MKLRLTLVIMTATLTGALSFAPQAFAAPAWAPASEAAITPGVVTDTEGSQCTSNFIFYDRSNNVYIGQSAHCSISDPSDDLDGCTAGSLPVGTKVLVGGATRPGTMVYNSWITMQEKKETNPDVCAFNDFALVQLDPADYGRVNPSVPVWGGPTGLSTGPGPARGERVFGYGNSPFRLGEGLLNPIQGTSLGQAGGGWSHQVSTLLPGIPGDSGSGLMDSQGRAFGTLSTLALFPDTLSNGVGDLNRELDYMRKNSPYDVTLAPGTEPFKGPASDLEKLLTGLLSAILGGG